MIGQRALTFKDLQDDTLSLMGFAGDTGNMRTLVQEHIRANHDLRVVMADYSFMVFPYPTTLTLTAGVRDYALHPAFRAPIYFRSRTTGEDLTERPSDMLLADGLDAYDASGEAGDFQLRGVLTVQNQPRTDGVITVASTQAITDAAKSVTIYGETPAGVSTEETITIGTGTGSVSFAANRIHGIRKNGTGWAGTLTVTGADATVCLTLGTAEYGKEFRHFHLLNSPDSAEVIEYSFYRFGARLEDDNDIPSIPTPFSRILVYDTCLDLQGYARWTSAEVQRFADKQMRLEHDLNATYAEGQSNGASASYVTFIPR